MFCLPQDMECTPITGTRWAGFWQVEGSIPFLSGVATKVEDGRTAVRTCIGCARNVEID